MGGYQLMQIVLGPSVPIFGHFLPQLFSQSPEYLSLSPRQCIIHALHPRTVKDHQTTSNANRIKNSLLRQTSDVFESSPVVKVPVRFWLDQADRNS